jgi:hypothetical protein
MVAPVVYRSDDASAPVLNGTVGSLINLLDKILVTGYGSKPAAGWTKPFTGTNSAAFRMGAGGTAERMYLQVLDTNALYATIRGFVSMTDVNTGVEPFPRVVDATLYYHKSSTGDSTARAWFALATPTCFYLFCNTNGTALLAPPTPSQTGNMFFGEYYYEGVGFTHNVAIIGASSTGLGSSKLFNRPAYGTPTLGHWIARSWLNLPDSAIAFSKLWLHYFDVNVGSDYIPIGHAQNFRLDQPVTATTEFSPVRVASAANGWTMLGRMPGIYGPMIGDSFPTQFAIIDGVGALTGNQIMIVRGYAESSGNAYDANLAFNLTNW